MHRTKQLMIQPHGSELVSIVIPTYRGDRFIREALASVACQTHVAWELIVVEDGSQGETEAIVRQFAADHPEHRIEYLRHSKNISQSAARNTGFQAARGNYVALLDVDDRWQPSHLAAAVAALKAERADLAYSAVAMFDDETGLVFSVWGPRKKELERFPHSLLERSFITPSSVVFRRDLIHRVGLFDVSLAWCEDLEYWIRCAAAGVKFTLVKGCTALYRKNHSQAQTSGTSRLTEAYARVIDRHLHTLPNPPRSYHKLAAKLYFGAAWCHATTRCEQDPTADPARAPALLLRAAELHRTNLRYKFHRLLVGLCERLQSPWLRQIYFRILRPRHFARIGNLMPNPQ